MKAKGQLMRELYKTVSAWDISQKTAAARLGLSQPRLNDRLRGKIDKFSLDALFDLAGSCGLRVSVALRKVAAEKTFPLKRGNRVATHRAL